MTSEHVKTRRLFGARGRFRIALLCVFVSLPVVVIGARQAIDGMRIAPEKWVSATHPERQQFDRFRTEFEGNDIVLISWAGCTIDDLRLHKFEQLVVSLANSALAAEQKNLYDRVVTGYSALQRLTTPPLNLAKGVALRRLRGVLVGPDDKTTCAVIVLTDEGNEQRAASIERLVQLAETATGLKSDQLHIAGPPHDGVAIDLESVRGVNIFSTLCTIVAALICAWSLRSWRLTGVIIGVACFGQGCALAIVYYLGLTLDAILIVIPPLIFVLTVSAGVHFVNYFGEQSAIFGHENATKRALQIGWKPCLLAALTTAIGLASLTVSQITPIILFGSIAAASLLTTTAILMCILPGVLQRHFTAAPCPRSEKSERRWERFADLICGHSRVLATLCTLVLIISVAGLQYLTTSVDAQALFSPSSRISRDYRWFETHIGVTVPVEVVLDFPVDSALSFRQRVELLSMLHENIRQDEGISGVISALSFAPTLPSPQDAGSMWTAALIFKRMEVSCEEYAAMNYFHEQDGQQSWRITGYVSALNGADYAQVKDRLRKTIDQILANTGESTECNVRYTGMMPLIQSVQTAILHDLFRSFLTAFVLIAVAIAIVLRNFRLTCAAMLPNLFPVSMIFGGMGWFGIPADIGTVMTASVALGIAIDDTIHFLTNYRRYLSTGSDNEQAIHLAIQKSGRAMLQTTLICTLGMLVFTASSFVPTFRFGLVMALALLTALIGDLVFLPALLNSQFGKWLIDARTPPTQPQAEWSEPVSERVLHEV